MDTHLLLMHFNKQLLSDIGMLEADGSVKIERGERSLLKWFSPRSAQEKPMAQLENIADRLNRAFSSTSETANKSEKNNCLIKRINSHNNFNMTVLESLEPTKDAILECYHLADVSVSMKR